MARINIVIPTRNRSETLKYSLKSCLDQNYDDYKVYVIDNSDDDSSYKLVKSFDSKKIEYYKTDKVLSMQDNWEYGLNYLLDKDVGGYISYIGDDDGLVKNSLHLLDNILRESQTEALRLLSPVYLWPIPKIKELKSKLFLHYSNEYTTINSEQILKLLSEKLCLDPFFWFLPDIYRGLVSFDVIKKIRSKNDVFFDHFEVDLYSGLLVATEIDFYTVSSLPIFINGMSKFSNGLSCISVFSKFNFSQEIKSISDEFINLNTYKTFKNIGEDLKVWGEASHYDSLLIADCILQAKKNNPKVIDILFENLIRSMVIELQSFKANENLFSKLYEILNVVSKRFNLFDYKEELLKSDLWDLNKQDFINLKSYYYNKFSLKEITLNSSKLKLYNVYEVSKYIKDNYLSDSFISSYKRIAFNKLYFFANIQEDKRNSISLIKKNIPKDNFNINFYIEKDYFNTLFKSDLYKSYYYIFQQSLISKTLTKKDINKINFSFDQIWVDSFFKKDIYINLGFVPSKIRVIPNAIDETIYNPNNKILEIETNKTFKFLFINNFKDISVLQKTIKCYLESFSSNDDVCLIIKNYFTEKDFHIKSFINDQVSSISPEIVFYNNHEVLSLPSLYCSCDCLVYPQENLDSLIVLEAMFSKLPVITINNSEYTDYCNNENSLLINSEFEYIDDLDEEYLGDNHYRINFDFNDLIFALKYSYNEKNKMLKKAEKAYYEVIDNYTWDNVFKIINNNIIDLKLNNIFRFTPKNTLSFIEQKAKYSYDNSLYEESEKLYLDLLAYKKDNYLQYYYLGFSQYKQYKYEEAIDSFSESIDLGNETKEVFEYMAKSLNKLGEKDLASLYFDKFNKINLK